MEIKDENQTNEPPVAETAQPETTTDGSDNAQQGDASQEEMEGAIPGAMLSNKVTEDRCMNCHAWLQRDTHSEWGFCRQLPPVPVYHPGINGGDIISCFPILQAIGWCAQHKRTNESRVIIPAQAQQPVVMPVKVQPNAHRPHKHRKKH